MIEQQEKLEFFKEQTEKQQGLVLVSLFSTSGSTYQKSGANLLVGLDGRTCGLISGGCLEPEISSRALEAWQRQAPDHWTIDTRSEGEALFGYGLGCQGLLTLVFEPVLFENQEQRDLIQAMLSSSQVPRRLIQSYEPDRRLVRRALLEGETCLGDANLIQDQHQLSPGSLLLDCPLGEARLISIFGGGADALPLARLCAAMGWQTHVMDRSAAKLEKLDWPDGVGVSAQPLEESIDGLLDSPAQYVIAMTHNFESDARIVAAVHNRPQIPYLGLLGPAHRRDAVLDFVSESREALDRSLKSRLFAPVGLKTGGRSPSEIALSILAEIQAVAQGSSLLPAKLHESIAIVILAAGASRRLDGPKKQLVSFQDKTLLRHAIDRAHEVDCDGVYVVIGAYAEELSSQLSGHEVVVYNPNWQQGLSSSIQAGFKAAVPEGLNERGRSVLFCLADQPFVTRRHLESLIAKGRSQQQAVVASGYEGTLGVPALVSSSLAGDIAGLTGDQGCKPLFGDAYAVIDGAEAAFDVDTQEDLERLRAWEGRFELDEGPG